MLSEGDTLKVRFTTTLDDKIIKELKKMAIDEGKAVNELIPEMIRIYKWYQNFYEKQLKKN